MELNDEPTIKRLNVKKNIYIYILFKLIFN